MTEAEKDASAATAEADDYDMDNDMDWINSVVTCNQCKINVGNLPKDITEQQLRDHFAGHEIQGVEIHSYLRYTLALLLFKNQNSAQKAIEAKNGSMLNGRRLRAEMEYRRFTYAKSCAIVTVVDEDVTEEQLHDRVKKHCEVSQVFIFHPLGYVHLGRGVDKAYVIEKLNASGLKTYDVNQRDHNHHVDLWCAAKLFFRNRNRVQLSNVPQKWVDNEEELKKACPEAGNITEICTGKKNKSPSNYARVYYAKEEQAQKAAELLNGNVFEGKRIHALHLSSALLPNYKTSVYVSPLGRTVTEEEVYDHFKQFGEIDFVNRRDCRDNAIICFKTNESTEKALACTTMPAPTEANKDATKTVAVKRYDGPLLFRVAGMKRSAAAMAHTSDDAKKNKEEVLTKADKNIIEKLRDFFPVYVSNLPYDSTWRDLRNIFESQGGEVQFGIFPQHDAYNQSGPWPVKSAMVYLTRRMDADNAVKTLHQKVFNRHHLYVTQGRCASNFNRHKTVKLSNIVESLSEKDIFHRIRPLGKIVHLTKKSRWLAFVEFADAASVKKILQMKQEHLPIECTFSKVQEDVSRRLYKESDSICLLKIKELLRHKPKILSEAAGNRPRSADNRPRLADKRHRMADNRPRLADKRHRMADNRPRMNGDYHSGYAPPPNAIQPNQPCFFFNWLS